jgi:cytochrome b pre-mRNA-processing protein 3
MLALLKRKNPYAQPAKAVYGQLLEKTRAPVFYAEYGVPDSFDGRFDLLILHVFFVVKRLAHEGRTGRDFNQALFDATFADMDQTLRERGIGDVGVPKHMRRMMKAFNGRMHAYSAALGDDKALAEALMRNLYGTSVVVDMEKASRISDYVLRSIAALEKQPLSDIIAGRVIF